MKAEKLRNPKMSLHVPISASKLELQASKRNRTNLSNRGCRTTPCPWSPCPPGQFFWQVKSRGSFWATITISTFLPELSFMLKSYRVVVVVGGGPWDFIVSPSPNWPFVLLFLVLGMELGLWGLGLGLGLDNKQRFLSLDYHWYHSRIDSFVTGKAQAILSKDVIWKLSENALFFWPHSELWSLT